MKIRSKLSFTFILLLLFGVVGVSSYSILFIHSFLLSESIRNMELDGYWMQNTLRYFPSTELNPETIARIGRAAGYDLVVFDQDGRSLISYFTKEDRLEDMYRPLIVPDSVLLMLSSPFNQFMDNRPDSDLISLYAPVPLSENRIAYFRLSQEKSRIFEPVATVRWIIYTGMFISMGLILIVSWLFSRHLSEPIIQLTKAAGRIADGEIDHEIHLSRSDEFGTLAKSLNRMASHLREDKKNIQRSYERQQQFFEDITHEVRNPLHTIMGSLEMLEFDKLDPEKRNRYLAMARSQTERLDHLFRDLMTLQHYDSDEYFVQKEACDLARIVENVELVYQDKTTEKGLIFSCDKHPALVQADPQKIEQVLENLVSNAVKYTQRGEISIRYKRQPDGAICVTVSDTGAGIPEDFHDKLFDRFTRTDKARSRDKGGTGLGLAVVKSILDAHQSEIKVESKPGEGTTFRFVLAAAGNKPTSIQ